MSENKNLNEETKNPETNNTNVGNKTGNAQKTKNVTVEATTDNNSAKLSINIKNIILLLIVLTSVAAGLFAVLKIVSIWGGYSKIFFSLLRTGIWLTSIAGGLLSIYLFLKNKDKLYIVCLIINLALFIF